MTYRIYIVHGWTYTTEYWDLLVEELKKRKIKPVMLHVPGLTKPSERVWDIEGYVTWLEEELKDEDQVILLGHSNGGRIALNFAARNHTKLEHLILIGSAGIYHDEALLRIKRWALRNVAAMGKKVVPMDKARRVFYKSIRAKDYYEAPENMRATMRNMLESDKRLDARKIKVPTTLIWGEKDQYTPLPDGRLLNAQIENSKLEVIPHAKHSPYHTHPKQVADIIEKVVKG